MQRGFMPKMLVAIPLYNHGGQIGAVIDDVMRLAATCSVGRQDAGVPFAVLVVDDGSTDGGAEAVRAAMLRYNAPGLGYPPLDLISQPRNLGKGKAILRAADWAHERGFTHIITMDADGQHLAADLPLFFQAVKDAPAAFVVGKRDFTVPNVPKSSKFGRAFSAFWMRLQTGVKSPDMQSGFRAYPVPALRFLSLGEARYSFETEVLVRAAWAGFTLLSVPINVYYPPADERVSHFAALHDNMRISMLNTRLTIRALVPLPFSQHEVAEGGKVARLKPLAALRLLLVQHNTPALLAFSTFVAVLVNMLPTPGFQSFFLLCGIGFLRLNRVWALTVSHLCWAPACIALDIEAGHFILHGELLTDISWQTLGREGWQRIWEWVVGGLVFGPLFSIACGLLVYAAACWISRGLGGRGRCKA